MEVYGPLLEAVFRRDEVPAYISRRSDILEQPVLTLLLSAVDAVTGGFEYEDVFRCLKTGMTDLTAAGMRSSGKLRDPLGNSGQYVAAGRRLDGGSGWIQRRDN